MITYILNKIDEISREDRWIPIINRIGTAMLVAYTLFVIYHIKNIPIEEGPDLPFCVGKTIGNRLLVNHKVCCCKTACECMTYEEFWEVFDSCKQSLTPTTYSMPYFVADNYLFTGTQIMRVE